jgi:flagellar protein FliO/FliZ
VNGFALEFVSLMVSLTLVLGAAFVFLRILKRFQPGGEQSAELAFMRAVPIGPRERIVLIRWRDEVLLLGVSAGAVTLLTRGPAPPHQLKDADIDKGSDPPAPYGAGVGGGVWRADRLLHRQISRVDARVNSGSIAAAVLMRALGSASAWLRGGVSSLREWGRLVRSRMRSK